MAGFIRWMSRAVAVCMGCFMLEGCVGLNNVSEIKADDWATPSPSRAVLLYGVGLEAAWSAQGFGVYLDEYDAELGATRGNCFRYNHTTAVARPPVPGTLQHFAFSVDPGYFTTSAISSPHIEEPYGRVAFYAAPGTVTYVGDFIYRGNKLPMLLRRDLEAGRAALKEFPTLKGDLVLAETIPVKSKPFWLCTP